MEEPARDEYLPDIPLTDIALMPNPREVDMPSPSERAGLAPVELADGLCIVQLSRSDVARYVLACDPRGLNFEQTGYVNCLYAFVRAPASWPPYLDWDPDYLIRRAISLSRYVVVNAHCSEYSVRMVGAVPGRDERLVPLENPRREYAFRVPSGERHWLTQEDAEALGALLRTYLQVKDRLPKRVQRAIRRCDLSFHTPYAEDAAVLLTSAFESLFKTGRSGLTWQFGTRLPKLAREVGITSVTRRQAESFYGLRSRAVHGAPLLVAAQSDASARLRLMQVILTRVLRRAIQDSSFRANFRSAASIEERWPIPPRRKRTTRKG